MDSVEVDPVDVVERPVDAKGRVSIGTDKSGKIVRVAVIEVEEREDDD